MKKILFVLSVLTLLSYGCNRNSEQGAGGEGAGMQREEESGKMNDTQPSDTMDTSRDATGTPSTNQDTQQ